MTLQVPDSCRYHGEEYQVTALAGGELFKPQDFGLEPREGSSNCYRGNIMHYDCLDNQLILSGLLVWADDPPAINGVASRRMKEDLPFTGTYSPSQQTYSYHDLNLKTHFTGILLITSSYYVFTALDYYPTSIMADPRVPVEEYYAKNYQAYKIQAKNGDIEEIAGASYEELQNLRHVVTIIKY